MITGLIIGACLGFLLEIFMGLFLHLNTEEHWQPPRLPGEPSSKTLEKPFELKKFLMSRLLLGTTHTKKETSSSGTQKLSDSEKKRLESKEKENPLDRKLVEGKSHLRAHQSLSILRYPRKQEEEDSSGPTPVESPEGSEEDTQE